MQRFSRTFVALSAFLVLRFHVHYDMIFTYVWQAQRERSILVQNQALQDFKDGWDIRYQNGRLPVKSSYSMQCGYDECCKAGVRRSLEMRDSAAEKHVRLTAPVARVEVLVEDDGDVLWAN